MSGYVPHTVWVNVPKTRVQRGYAPFDTSGPSQILAQDPRAFRQPNKVSNLPAMVLPGTPKYDAPQMMGKIKTEPKASTKARDEQIIRRRMAGEMFKDIAADLHLSATRCQQIFYKATRHWNAA